MNSTPDNMPGFEGSPLARSFFERETATVARELLGKILVSTAGGEVVRGRIVETEAYLGSNDPGSHAATRGITPRNEAMYGQPGRTYVYFTYGNHHMLNLVTETEGTAGAVLIRAVEPLGGVEAMQERRPGRVLRDLANGPGKLAAAFGVALEHNRSVLGEGPLSVYDSEPVPDDAVATSGRVGLSAGHELQLRFYLKDCPFVSRGRTGPLPERRRTTSEEDRS